MFSISSVVRTECRDPGKCEKTHGMLGVWNSDKSNGIFRLGHISLRILDTLLGERSIFLGPLLFFLGYLIFFSVIFRVPLLLGISNFLVSILEEEDARAVKFSLPLTVSKFRHFF